MSEDVKRTIRESKKKIQAARKDTSTSKTKKTGARKTPAGRRLDALRKRDRD